MKRTVLSCVLLASACVAAEPTDEPTAELRAHGPQLLQAGAGITLFATTDDDHAIYQRGQQVFAVAAGSAPELIADVPAGNLAFAFPVGDVAFVWTNPDRTRPGFGVSPLYIWSAATGSHLASASSAIGTWASSANHEGDLVVFTANSPASGATGDIVLAATDLSWQTTLAAGVAMSFPGPLAPRVVFRGHTDDVVGVTCQPGAGTATYSTWQAGQRTDHPQPLSLPVRFWIDQQHRRVVSSLAGSRNPIVFGEHGVVTTIPAPAANVFFGGDGAVIYLAPPVPGQPLAVFRARIGEEPRHVADVRGINATSSGSTGLALPVTSPDGRYLSFSDAVAPPFGLPANVRLADMRGDDAPVTLDTTPGDVIFGQPFTEDSKYALYARLDTSTFSVGPMFGAGPRGNRQFSDELGWSWTPAFGSTVVYNDNTDATFTTADLWSVDLSRATLEQHLIAPQANVAYFSTRRGRGVAYTIDAGANAGLYEARVD